MPTQTIIICESDFDTKLKNLQVLVDGKTVDASDTFVLLADGKSFIACEIEIEDLESPTFCPLGVLMK